MLSSSPSNASAWRSRIATEPGRDSGAPFIVGVTGHRDLRDEDRSRVTDAVDGFLGQLEEAAPNTRITITCGMAEGADLLVAATALRRDLHVSAVLPMPLELYRSDFGEDGRRELERLLGDPRVELIELPLPRDVPRDALVSPGAERDRLYANLAEHLVASSNVLLALWDGETTGLTGGTSDVVLSYLRADGLDGQADVRIIPTQESLRSAHAAFVHWVPTARQGRGEHTGRADEPSFLTGGDGSGVLWQRSTLPDGLATQLEELDDFNEQYERLRAKNRLPESASLLAPVPLGEDDPTRRSLETIDREYVHSDSLAVSFQQRSDLLFKVYSIAVATMGIAFLAFGKISASNPLLFVYLGVFGLGLFTFYFAQRRRWLASHLRYRALAETMRTRFFLVLAGAHEGVDVDELMRTSGTHRLPGFGLITAVLRTTEPPPPPARAAGAQTEAIDYVREAWVVDQSSYFSAKVARLHRTHRRLGRVKLVFVAVFVGAAITLIFAKDNLSGSVIWEFAGHGEKPGEKFSAKEALIFVMGALPFLLGVWELYNNKMATKELLWQYRNQADYFGLAERELASTSEPASRKRIIADVGRRSLVEGYLWAMHRFHREHEPPVAG